MRDLIIPNYDSYDVDQVICDMTDAYVIEGEDESDLPGSESSFNLMDAVEQSLHSGMETRGGKISNDGHRITSLLNRSTATPRRDQSSSKLHQFKLDPSFFVKYPGLYDPDAVARSMPPRMIGGSRMQRPLPLTINAIRYYVDLL